MSSSKLIRIYTAPVSSDILENKRDGKNKINYWFINIEGFGGNGVRSLSLLVSWTHYDSYGPLILLLPR
jgi:hypothetical protein